MDNEINKIIETTNFLDEYSQFKQLKEKLEVTDILVFPKKYYNDEYYFAQETINLVKCGKQLGTNIDIITDDDIKIRSLHSFDIWLPLIYIAKEILFPIALGLLTNFIYDKLKGREHEDANVNVDIVVKNGKKEKFIHYNGPAKTFKENMDKIDLDK